MTVLDHSAWCVGSKWLGGAGNLMSNGGTGSHLLVCWFENCLEGQVIC